MKTIISIQILPEEEKDHRKITEKILIELKKNKIDCTKESIKYVVEKKSIDARRKQIKLNLKLRVYINEEIEDTTKLPEWKKATGKKSVIVVGSGPAGLFASLKLLEYGIKPVIIERGSDTSTRRKDIALISTKQTVNENSNYCFVEGGAGTFSDGKLYTRSNKRGDINMSLKILNYFGADSKILTDSHPHIGTDKLPQIINNITKFIVSMGGEILFDTQCTDLYFEKELKGIETTNTKTYEKQIIKADAVLLATGHSAKDIYEMIAKKSPESLEAKTFAVGVRTEHPRELIDSIQFHGQKENLGSAEYRLTSQQNGRGVYSFCMCPGGFVVPSSTGPEEIVVNGMSCAKRNSLWSNAAIVVETRSEDIPKEFVEKAKANNCESLKGLYWRTYLENLSYQNGDQQKAPAQRLTDFLNAKDSDSLPRSSFAPGLVSSRLDLWLPKQISERLKSAYRYFDTLMKGYITDEATLIAIETRTSTPVRILRDKESGECVGIKNLFPAGEGAGYAGGIISSAMDGENQALKIAKKLNG